MRCPKCGEELEYDKRPDAYYCDKCGEWFFEYEVLI